MGLGNPHSWPQILSNYVSRFLYVQFGDLNWTFTVLVKVAELVIWPVHLSLRPN